MISEWSAELTLTEESSKALFDVLHQQDLEFINGLLDGKHGFTLQSSDGRSVELVPAPKWIPCSKRLPDLNENGVSDMVLLCWSDGQMTVGAYQGDRTFVGQAWPTARDCRVTVTAWQSLPKPWKGADDE